MESLPSEADMNGEIGEYFKFVSQYYLEKANYALKANYQFEFSNNGDNYHWYLSVDREKVDYGMGCIEKADLTIHTSYCLWLQISSGKKNATLEYLKKTYTITGPLKLLLLFKTYFGSIVSYSRRRTKTSIDEWEKKGRKWVKPDSVVILNASPRMERGFTFRYLKHFISGMAEGIENIEVIHLYNNNIKIEACRGCEACWKEGEGKCVINDDGDSLIKKLLDTKLTVFALPLYVDSMPAKLKSLMDRFFVQSKPVFERAADGLTRHPVVDQRERYFALFAVCGFPELKHLEPLVDTFCDIGRNFHAPLIAKILRPGSQFLYLNPLLYPERIHIEKALYEAGGELASMGRVKGKTLKAIRDTSKVPMTEWRYYANAYWANNRKGGI